MGLLDLRKKLFRSGAPARYSRIVGWIKTNYEQRFIDQMTDGEIRNTLEWVIQDEIKKGIPEKTLKGFRAYIKKQDYKGLIR